MRLDRYYPEQHYMRGPGPKWLEKHAGHRTAASVQDDIGRLSKLMRRIALRLRWPPPSATTPSEQSPLPRDAGLTSNKIVNGCIPTNDLPHRVDRSPFP
jgi:hypothetical protein